MNLSSTEADDQAIGLLEAKDEKQVAAIQIVPKPTWFDELVNTRDEILAPYETGDFGTEEDIILNPKRYK